jgi:hypothetical protein
VAQTKKKKRSTKHRGNAAGVVEARGRTGRKVDEKGSKGSKPAKPAASSRPRGGNEARLARLGKPPTWKSALWRAVAATAIFFVILLLAFKQKPAQALALSGFMLLVYIPLGYYTDLMLHRRFMRKQAAARGGGSKGGR